MNRILIVLFLSVHGSLSGKILLTDVVPSETDVTSEAQLFYESISPEGE